MLSTSQTDALINIVREAGRREIIPRFRALSDSSIRRKSSADDLVTDADVAAETFIMREAKTLFPDAAFVGEEAGLDDVAIDAALGSDICVVIDPIDGTWNFAHGLSLFGTILAVVSRGTTVFGLLYDPVLDDWIMARRGEGSWFCRPGAQPRRLRLAQSEPGPKSKGYLPLFQFEDDKRPTIARAMADMGRVTSLGSSCHEYRQLLLGAADFNMSALLNVWDHAAGALAVEEAGGCVELAHSEAYSPKMKQGCLIAARRGDILKQLTKVTTE
ncbi:inositol monophosphatase family protein [Paracoccus albus]|uniref:inositol monophosphatase family protein n=1 Tax=Paracoccus albus TaxID=3017784 RepID=UPI0022F1333E|nr:inositol monophosphatase [Paracoccus albus]WBU60847.1 inositol monophosphatase [Paracoccus albus]